VSRKAGQGPPAKQVIGKMIALDNTERLHSDLGFLRPVAYDRGEPETLHK